MPMTNGGGVTYFILDEIKACATGVTCQAGSQTPSNVCP